MIRLKELSEPEEIKRACNLLDEYVGGDHKYQDYMNDSSIVFGMDGIAAGTFKVLNDELNDFDSYFLDNLEDRSVDHLFMKIGYIESIAVKEIYRNHGIAKLILNKGMSFLRSKGCDDFVAMCWISGEPDQSLPLFLKMGFKEVEHFIQPWEGIHCVICGDNCKCDATMVYKDVS